MLRLCVIGCALAVALTGCLHRKPSAPAAAAAGSPGGVPPRPVMTPDTRVVGKVARVNPAGQFVVLNFPIGRLPALQQKMDLYRDGMKVGEVLVTGPHLDDDIVADIVAGTAQPGDEAR